MKLENGREAKLVFIVGAPRSGTTWLNLLLFQHPSVAAAPETHIFSQYLSQLENKWKRHESADYALPNLINRDEYNQMLRTFASRVMEKIAERKPGAEVIVEKTPDHCRYGDMIHKLFPDAYVLHIVRDPRAVANSLIHASRSWAAKWAPSDPINAAKRWKRNVAAGREIAGIGSNYKEIRYEELLSRGPEILGEILEWMGLASDKQLCEKIIEACRIENIKQGRDSYQRVSSSQENTDRGARKGEADSWKGDLSKRQIRIIEAVAGDLMDELRYQKEFPDSSRRPAQLVLREWAESILSNAFRWMVKNMPDAMTNSAKKIGQEELR